MSVSEETKSISGNPQSEGEIIASDLNPNTENSSEFATLSVKVDSTEVSSNQAVVATTPNSTDSSRKSNLRGRWRRTASQSSSVKKESQRVGEVTAAPAKENVTKIGFSVPPQDSKINASTDEAEGVLEDTEMEQPESSEYTSLTQERPAKGSKMKGERGGRYQGQGNDRRWNRSETERERPQAQSSFGHTYTKNGMAKQWSEDDLVKRVSLWQKIKNIFSFCFSSNKNASAAQTNASEKREERHYSGHRRHHRYYRSERNNRGRSRTHQS